MDLNYYPENFWRQLGIENGDFSRIRSVLVDCDILLQRHYDKRISFSITDSCLDSLNSEFDTIIKKYDLHDRIDVLSSDMIPLDQGVNIINRLAQGTKVIGVSGIPGSGKSTLLDRIDVPSSTLLLDEFWQNGAPVNSRGENTYSSMIDTLIDAVSQQKSAVVCGSRLDPTYLDVSIFLNLSFENRLRNVHLRKSQGKDGYIKDFPSLMNRVHLFRYKVAQPFCDHVIATDALEY